MTCILTTQSRADSQSNKKKIFIFFNYLFISLIHFIIIEISFFHFNIACICTLCMMIISFITQTKTHVNIWPSYYFPIAITPSKKLNWWHCHPYRHVNWPTSTLTTMLVSSNLSCETFRKPWYKLLIWLSRDIRTGGDSFASDNSSPPIRIYRNTQNKLFNNCNCDIG